MSDEPISVVFVRTAYGTMGGRAKMLLRLLRGIDKDQFDITLVTQREDEFCRRASDLDITIQILPFKGILNTFGGGLLEMPFYKQAVAGARLLQYNNTFRRTVETPDIIWFDGTRSFVTLLPYANLSSATSIWAIGLLQESEGIMRYINGATLRSANHIFIESDGQAERLLTKAQYETHHPKITTFHKGIDTEKFDPNRFPENGDQDNLKVGTAALINPRKGLEYFIDAAALVLEEYPNVTFTIAGEPARESDEKYQVELMQRAREHDIDENVNFLGWVDDMPRYLNSLDVFVLPSLNEGIPGAVREALAMELPTVATDVGGVSDVIVEKETGLLVNPENSRAIAEAVIDIIDDPEQRTEISKQGRQLIIDDFSVSSYIESYEGFLKQVINQ